MFDFPTLILFFIFCLPTLIFSDYIYRFEQEYIDNFGDKHSFYPKYANRHPLIAFILIIIFNVASIFFIRNIIQFSCFVAVQFMISFLGYMTMILKKVTPKAYDYIAVTLSFLIFMSLFLINIL